MATQNDTTIAGLARSILKSAREADDLVADDKLTAKLDEIQNAADSIEDIATGNGQDTQPETARDQQSIIADVHDRIRGPKPLST